MEDRILTERIRHSTNMGCLLWLLTRVADRVIESQIETTRLLD